MHHGQYDRTFEQHFAKICVWLPFLSCCRASVTGLKGETEGKSCVGYTLYIHVFGLILHAKQTWTPHSSLMPLLCRIMGVFTVLKLPF